jgi:hypothetical protein
MQRHAATPAGRGHDFVTRDHIIAADIARPRAGHGRTAVARLVRSIRHPITRRSDVDFVYTQAQVDEARRIARLRRRLRGVGSSAAVALVGLLALVHLFVIR